MDKAGNQDNFIHLLDDLSASKFQITPEQRMRALTLYIVLRIRGISKGSRRLPNLIGPLLCRSAEEQMAFHRIFRSWFPEETDQLPDKKEDREIIDPPMDPVIPEPEPGPSDEELEVRDAKRAAVRKRIRKIILFVVVPLFLIFGTWLLLNRISWGSFFPSHKHTPHTHTAAPMKQAQPSATLQHSESKQEHPISARPVERQSEAPKL